MKISGVICICTCSLVISLVHAKSFHHDRESSIFKDIFGNIKKFKKGVLSMLIQPPKRTPANYPRPFVQFSSKPVFIVSSTQRPGIQTDNNGDNLNTETSNHGVHTDTTSSDVHTDTTSYGVHTDTTSYGVHTENNSYGVHTDSTSYGVHTENNSYGVHTYNNYAVHTENASNGVHIHIENSSARPEIHTVKNSYSVHKENSSGGSENTSDDVHTEVDMALYREDVIIKQLHNKKTRKNTNKIE